MLEIALIRHGKTKGNLEHRYIGRTDQPLCEEGRREIVLRKYPPAQRVFCSPYIRCTETAGIIYPGMDLQLEPDLREFDFGDFEGKNYLELANNTAYQAFVNSGRSGSFPGGEDSGAFKLRCVKAFKEICSGLLEQGLNRASIICHGGTIMAVMESACLPKQDYYSYQAANGCGYVISLQTDKTCRVIRKLG